MLCSSSVWAGGGCEGNDNSKPFAETGKLDEQSVQRISEMNASRLCHGNCKDVSVRLAKFFNTGDKKLLELPPLIERVRILSQSFKNLYSTLFDSEAGVTIDELAKDEFPGAKNIEMGEDKSIAYIEERLKVHGGGSHALLVATNSRIESLNHMFNVLLSRSGKFVVTDGYYAINENGGSQFLKSYKNEFDYILFKPIKPDT